jgi:hypothetical protein
VSTNDPHLEAQMELESRSPAPHDAPPPGFARKQAWVLAAVLAVVAIGWIVYAVAR